MTDRTCRDDRFDDASTSADANEEWYESWESYIDYELYEEAE